MQRKLLKHPGSQSPVTEVVGDAVRFEDGRVQFIFMATGELEKIVIPPSDLPARRDELWRHTCFEAFLRCEGEAYIELNFSPSEAWAAYRFDGYRSGMAKVDIGKPAIEAKRHGPMLSLRAEVALGSVAELTPWENWEVGLSAVLEADDSSRSYWALAHPTGDPDFHHRHCFDAKLAPDASL